MGEKNILVNRGIPRDSNSGPGTSGVGGRGIPSGYGLGTRGGGLDQDFDNSDSIAAWLQSMWAEEAATAAREQEAARIIATELARKDAEAAALQVAQRQAEETAHQLAQRQTEEVAREIAFRQAEEAARQFAQHLAEEARHTAELAVAAKQRMDAEAYIKHASDAGRLWSMVASPNAPPQELPKGWEKASEVAKRFLVRKAVETIGKRLSVLAALYPSELAPGDRAAQICATEASELGIPTNTDLEFIASKNGTIDLTHRLTPDPEASDGRLKWVEADGVNVGSKVRVRPVAYDSNTNTYNFTRDGDTTPSLTWTPQARPIDSSTSLPIAPQDTSVYVGADSTPIPPEIDVHSEHTAEPDDYILELPAELGSEKLYIYFKNPRDVPGVAIGAGQPVVGTWLGESTRGQGAPIPSQIADGLRGQRYIKFARMREAIWEA